MRAQYLNNDENLPNFHEYFVRNSWKPIGLLYQDYMNEGKETTSKRSRLKNDDDDDIDIPFVDLEENYEEPDLDNLLVPFLDEE